MARVSLGQFLAEFRKVVPGRRLLPVGHIPAGYEDQYLKDLDQYLSIDDTQNDLIILEPVTESLELSDNICDKDTCCINDVHPNSATCCTVM